MNFGDIWSNRKMIKNNYIYTKKITNEEVAEDINKLERKIIGINREVVFNSIFSAKTGNNKAKKTLNNINRAITGFSRDKGDTGTRYWGTPTWYLFHTIAARVDEVYYKKNHKYVWDFIKSCCSVLPCPYCRSDAVNYVSHITYNMVDDKDKFIKILFDFHNHVNKKKKSALFEFSELKMYEKANIKKVLKLFSDRFFRSYYTTREFQDWNKIKFRKEFITFVENIEFV